MWQTEKPKPVKLIIGILAANEQCLKLADDAVVENFGAADFSSEIWHFDSTNYYCKETGPDILRQFITIQELVQPDQLADIKLRTNKIEQKLAEEAKKLSIDFPRPVNLDPGIIEPSKLILASTKNFPSRIYLAKNIYAEVTLSFSKGKWQTHPYTYHDYASGRYDDFMSKVRDHLVEQLREE